MLSIKVHIIDLNITKTLQFNPTTLVFDALKIIREKVPETNTETGKLLLIFFFSILVCYVFFFRRHLILHTHTHTQTEQRGFENLIPFYFLIFFY